MTPIEIATAKGYHEIVQILESSINPDKFDEPAFKKAKYY